MVNWLRRRAGTLALGLQLRNIPGKRLQTTDGEWKDENEYVKELEGLRLLDHKALVAAGPCLEFTAQRLIQNTHGCYVRGGRKNGLGLARGSRLFLWNDFAAYSADDSIIEHDKIGLAARGADEAWLRAISVLWTSSITQYFLFFELSAAWGIGRNQIDLGDAKRVRLPILDDAIVGALSDFHRQLAAQLAGGRPFDEKVRRELDSQVGEFLGLPRSLIRTATDFAINRLALNKGKVPVAATTPPKVEELLNYAARLAADLDEFVGGRSRHRVTIRYAPAGIAASVEMTDQGTAISPRVKSAVDDDAVILKQILAAAEQQFSQWVYVKRSVRLFEGETIHLIKPARRMEWTEARASLDADDIIAEIAAKKGAAR